MSEPVKPAEKRILVVDDDDGARESITILLGIDGHKVTEAKSGAEALGCFREGRFDLVITDYLMPNMFGDELAHNIRAVAPDQPIVMVTAYFEYLGGRTVAADAVLAKPFGVDELRLAMARPMARGLTPCGMRAAPQTELPDFARHTMTERASVMTQVLSDILQQRSMCLRRSGFGK